jgi:hypothetical protein
MDFKIHCPAFHIRMIKSDVTAFNTHYPPLALPVRRSRTPTACQPLPPTASYHNHSITNFSAINEDLS